MRLPRRLKFVIDALNRYCLCSLRAVCVAVVHHFDVESNVANSVLSKHGCSHRAACCKYYQDGVPDDGVEATMIVHACRLLSHAIFDRR